MGMTARRTTAFWIDEAYDRTYAGPPPSRFRNYLDSRLTGIKEETDRYGAAGWSSEVWRTATAPVMDPGFVREAPQIVEASLVVDDDEQHLILAVEVATRAFPGPWPTGVRHGWEHARSWDTPSRLVETPLRPGAPYAGTLVRVRTFVEPSSPPEAADLDAVWRAAESTIAGLVAQANAALAPVLDALRGQR